MVSWPIVGRFKNCNGMVGCFMIPIVRETTSGIQFFKWTQRFVWSIVGQERSGRWLGLPAARWITGICQWLQIQYFGRLEVIQVTTTFIDLRCEIWDAYGIKHSARRFFTSHTANMGVKRHLIKLQACWVVDRANGQRSGRRFFISHTTNMEVKRHLIKLQARWMVDQANGKHSIQRIMVHFYSEVRNMQ